MTAFRRWQDRIVGGITWAGAILVLPVSRRGPPSPKGPAPPFVA
jgi:hypothetical protein